MPARLLLVIATLPCGNSLTRELESPSDFRFQRECTGYDEEWDKCPDLGECGGPCQPQDCIFGHWQEWYSSGGCTGLRYRRREVTTANNECGYPCSGPTVESERQDVVDCEELYDCSFSAWSSWSSCNSSYDQSIRFRGIEEPASPEGNPCRGPLNETKACSSEDGPQSCLWTQWGSWGRSPASLEGECSSRSPRLQIELEGFTVELDGEDFSRLDQKSVPSTPEWGRAYSPAEENTRRDMTCKPMLMVMDLPEPIGPKLFILGEPVLKKFYTVYDAEKKRIGFGRAKHAPASLDVESDHWWLAAEEELAQEEEDTIASAIPIEATA